MSYRKRLSFLVVIDSIIVLTAIFFSQYILDTKHVFTTFLFVTAFSLLVGHHIFAYIFKLYKKVWQYASIGELISIFKAITWTIVFAGIMQGVIFHDVYFRALAITWMLHMLLIGGTRFSWRLYRDTYVRQNTNKKRTLVVGAGAAGTMVVRQLLHNNEAELLPVAFIDDDIHKQKLEILGLPVVGGIEVIESVVKEKEITNIVIAIPSLSKKELNKIFQECSKTRAKTQILPMIEDLMSGKVSVNQFRDVQVEDLLGREPVQLDSESIVDTISGKTVLVTGAGGSIGSEICRQICNFNPEKLILFGHGENSIYSIDMELRQSYSGKIEMVPVIGDIQDRARIFSIMEKYKPDVVYHAAAHKHVPLMEYNPVEAVKNNIFGTKNVAEAAETFGVGTFVMISSDKAVNPTNVMGATKRFAELIIQQMAKQSQTKFVAVRFGNVLGSRGSVIPLFKKQIVAGGPVTVTHPDMTRYFMTIPEASRLVIQAGTLARGGEIFVLDMGEPVRIVDLAKNLIKLSGYSVEEIGIEFTGLRPGEKMFEELLNENEVHKKQVFPKIHIGKAVVIERRVLDYFMENYEQMNAVEVKDYLLMVANNKIGEEEYSMMVSF
ncbi:polysaccharide biosynthesis protein [Schinkia azotoformans]|uniref:polysaccharide biosynthesis protein n=1 Tax=Schinkia azotoformans TaxID=1454 RepID=UPI002DBE9E9B|nr:nucleoside-diphosphate sugar epimerase/dehydratase [Schinkia azotoformans]MEC1771890.1 nucleoside-diphosphate sugar epimerase/dehydratase [Schinkia azotoformans]MED4366388.1 nucleoside-diphosphate sugar epimerase/dehydratase [Schinkia azotoformans]